MDDHIISVSSSLSEPPNTVSFFWSGLWVVTTSYHIANYIHKVCVRDDPLPLHSRHALHSTTSLTSIESKESLILDDLEETVQAVFVHDLPDNGASLVLHTSLYQVNWVDSCGTSGYMEVGYKVIDVDQYSMWGYNLRMNVKVMG